MFEWLNDCTIINVQYIEWKYLNDWWIERLKDYKKILYMMEIFEWLNDWTIEWLKDLTTCDGNTWMIDGLNDHNNKYRFEWLIDWMIRWL